MQCRLAFLLACCTPPLSPALSAAADLSLNAAQTALNKAVTFFDQKVSIEGGYLWRYDRQLELREGEGKATKTMAWVQPPGTPSVGMALLEVYKLTGNQTVLAAARRTAHALVRGQLQSGGWDYRIEFSPARRKAYAYRSDGTTKGRNTTTLDDNTTQSALTFLIHYDAVTEFQDAKVHEAAEFALRSLLKAQYPNGAWPQRFAKTPDPGRHPVRKANYPDSWSRKYQRKDYRGYYTYNDNTIADMVELMFLAGHVYESNIYRAAAEKAGDFIILSQMPEPQPAWAQQYNLKTQPAWARKFEPPSVTGGESQQVLRTLLQLYLHTGKKKYLEPIPRAIRYLRSSLRPDGRLARFYELKTNKPLYFTKDYQLTYKDDDMPTHYAFIVSSRLKSIERDYRRASDSRSQPPSFALRDSARLSRGLTKRAAEVAKALDERGAWVENGRLKAHERENLPVIQSGTFSANIRILGQYIASRKSQ